jgi:hypothetical protein
MNKLLSISFLCLTLLFCSSESHAQIAWSNGHQLFSTIMPLMDGMYDPFTHLVRVPNPGFGTASPLSRETAYYAFALLLRDQPGDRNKAEACLNEVLSLQYTDPSKWYYGTFKVVATEPTPGPGSGPKQGYEPLWRQFIGVTFEMILLDFSDRISSSTRDHLRHSIDIAVAGAQKDGDLDPDSTNPALMFAALFDFDADQRHDAADETKASAWISKVYAGYKKHGAFWEFNSPTYYGVDLIAITLLREHGSSPQIRSMGADLELHLWSQIANSYSPEMRNTAGPYDRSYFMDMTNYVALEGLWLSAVVPAGQAPLPAINLNTPKLLDALAIPLLITLKPQVPAQALAVLQHPVQPHMVTQQVDDARLATSWVGRDVLFGGETVHRTPNMESRPQYHPLTIHWKTPTGTVGWMYVLRGVVDSATASPTGITAQMQGGITFVISAPGLSASDFSGQHWKLPGLNLDIATDGTLAGAYSVGANYQVTYNDVHRFTMTKR